MEPKFLIFYALILLERKVYSVSIEGCPNGMINVAEDDDISLTCGQYSNQIDWYYSTDNTWSDYIGQCSGTSCYPTQKNEFTIQAKRTSWNSLFYKSTLGISPVTRENARYFHCEDSYWSDTCRLRVTSAPDEVVPQNCSVWISDWQVQGGCLVERMYASDDVYKCTWSVNNVQLTGVFQPSLTSYKSGRRSYMRGVCSFEQQIPFNGYNFTSSINYTYTISIDPGPQNSSVTTISIVPPKKPETNCSRIVLEGSTVTCMCISKNEGNPPAKHVWDGIDNDTLVLRNVRRQHSFTNYTCRQTWGPYGFINTSVNYTLRVAYGPSVVNISILENGTKTFRCTAMDVFPAAMFQWNIICDNQTDTMTTSTCTLPARDTHGDVVVQCTANNTAFPTSSVTTIAVRDYATTQTDIYLSGTEQSITQSNQQNMLLKDSSSSDSNNGGLIGGVVAAVIVVIIVVAVIVVIIVKRRKEEFNSERFTLRRWPRAFKFFHKKTPLSTPYTTVAKPSSATPIKRLAAPSGDLYTTATNTISVDYATVSDTIDNTVNVINRDCTPMASQSVYEMSDLKEAVKPTITSTPATAKTKTFQDTTGSIYMNVTEVPTDSGLGVYHIVPWRTMSENMNDSAAVAAVSEDEYNALNFEEDRSGQEDQAATYHHLEHE